MNATRIRHIENLLTQYEAFANINCPFDTFISRYFKANGKLTSPDRQWLVSNATDAIRWRLLLDHCTPPPPLWSNRLKTYFLSHRWKLNTKNEALPAHIRCSFPLPLFERIAGAVGPRRALQVCFILNEPPPCTLRVNTGKVTRDNLYKFLTAKGVALQKTASSPIGLILASPMQLKTLQEYNDKLFEVQDESTQLMAGIVDAKPGDTVLDYCAGRGGKAVIFGRQLEQKGRLVLHDVRANVLRVAETRLRNANVQNRCSTAVREDLIEKYRLLQKCDWVVCDVPCTGTGGLRRHPSLKWIYTDKWLNQLVENQENILAQARPFLKPKTGRLVYMTQSILNEENGYVVRKACEKLKLKLAEPPLSSLPLSFGLDGYFCAILMDDTSDVVCLEGSRGLETKGPEALETGTQASGTRKLGDFESVGVHNGQSASTTEKCSKSSSLFDAGGDSANNNEAANTTPGRLQLEELAIKDLDLQSLSNAVSKEVEGSTPASRGGTGSNKAKAKSSRQASAGEDAKPHGQTGALDVNGSDIDIEFFD